MSADPLEAEIVTGAIRALRRRAEAIRARASANITIIDRASTNAQPPVRIVPSESATALRIAKDFDRIADDLAEGGR